MSLEDENIEQWKGSQFSPILDEEQYAASANITTSVLVKI